MGGKMRRSRRSIPSSRVDSIVSAIAPYSWLGAARYSVDGVSGKVASFIDRANNSHSMTQAVSANQCALPSGQTALSGKLCATFVGDQRYVSSATATSWQFLHDGTGAEVVHVFIPTDVSAGNRYHLSTRHFGGERGFRAIIAGNIVSGQVETAAAQIVDGWATGALTAGVGYYHNWYYSESNPGHDWYTIRSGSTSRTGNSSGAPEVSTPGGTLLLGATRPDGNSPAKQHWACTLIWNRVLTVPERTKVTEWIRRKYGVM